MTLFLIWLGGAIATLILYFIILPKHKWKEWRAMGAIAIPLSWIGFVLMLFAPWIEDD